MQTTQPLLIDPKLRILYRTDIPQTLFPWLYTGRYSDIVQDQYPTSGVPNAL